MPLKEAALFLEYDLNVSNRVKYLGHIIREEMTDDENIY